jgi:Domain of unknown function (DUF929)
LSRASMTVAAGRSSTWAGATPSPAWLPISDADSGGEVTLRRYPAGQGLWPLVYADPDRSTGLTLSPLARHARRFVGHPIPMSEPDDTNDLAVPEPGAGHESDPDRARRSTVDRGAQPVKPRRLHPRTMFTIAVIAIVVILVSVVVVVKVTSSSGPDVVGETFQPVSSSDAANATKIPASVYDAVGITSPAAPIVIPTAVSSQPKLTYPGPLNQSLPGVFFYGAEFSPYAAAERWVVVTALSRFGTFEDLGEVESSSTVAFSSTPSFTFWKAHYSSHYLALQTNEHYSDQNLTGASYSVLQVPTSSQAKLVRAFTKAPASFPLVDVGNRYVVTGQSSYSPTILSGLSFSQIGDDLDQPSDPVTQAILASANYLSATVCEITSQRPLSVCASKAVVAAGKKMDLSGVG